MLLFYYLSSEWKRPEVLEQQFNNSTMYIQLKYLLLEFLTYFLRKNTFFWKSTARSKANNSVTLQTKKALLVKSSILREIKTSFSPKLIRIQLTFETAVTPSPVSTTSPAISLPEWEKHKSFCCDALMKTTCFTYYAKHIKTCLRLIHMYMWPGEVNGTRGKISTK